MTALYEFVRGAPKKVLERRGELTLAAAYDDKMKRLREEVEKRERDIDRLNKENLRLRGIVESVKRTVNYY